MLNWRKLRPKFLQPLVGCWPGRMLQRIMTWEGLPLH